MLLRSLGALLLLFAGTACHPPWKGDGDNDKFVRAPPSDSRTEPKRLLPAGPSALPGSSPADLGGIEITLVRDPEGTSSTGYLVVVRGDGSVRFRRYPELDGEAERTARVTTRAVRSLVQQFEMVEEPVLCDRELPPTAPPPSIWLGFRDGARALCMCGTELDDRCLALADAIDRAVHIERWVGPERALGRQSHR
jgi:hypothetical protein